jgi:hypothetical protein
MSRPLRCNRKKEGKEEKEEKRTCTNKVGKTAIPVP